MKKIRIIAFLTIIFIMSTVLNVYAADYADSPTLEPDQSSSGGENTPTDGENTPTEEEVTATLALTASATDVKAGDTITITLSAQCETGIESMVAILKYDATKLELITVPEHIGNDGYMSGSEVTGLGEIELVLAYNRTTQTPTESNLAKLQFKVLDAVTVNDILSIKLSGIEIGDFNENAAILEDKEITIKVPGEEEPEQNPDQDQNQDQDQDQNQNQDQGKDTTIADKDINEAGLSNYAFIIVLGAIIAVVLYVKCKKYKDVK